MLTIINYYLKLLTRVFLQTLLGQDGHDQRPHGQVNMFYFIIVLHFFPLFQRYFEVSESRSNTCCYLNAIWPHEQAKLSQDILDMIPSLWHKILFITMLLQALLGQDGHGQQQHGQVYVVFFHMLYLIVVQVSESLVVSIHYLNVDSLFINVLLQALGQDGHDQQPHGQVNVLFYLLCLSFVVRVSDSFWWYSRALFECRLFLITVWFQALLGQGGHDLQPHGQVNVASFFIVVLVWHCMIDICLLWYPYIGFIYNLCSWLFWCSHCWAKMDMTWGSMERCVQCAFGYYCYLIYCHFCTLP